MVGSDILLRNGATLKTMESLEILEGLLPDEVELAVQMVKPKDEKPYKMSIVVRQKESMAVLTAEAGIGYPLWCEWEFIEGWGERVANTVLRYFGRFECLVGVLPDVKYPLGHIPRFSSQDEFRMKVMLKGGM